MSFQDRHVVVTGGTGALGTAVVGALLERGATCHVPFRGFHDGRRLSARDVRYSFERLLQHKESEARWLFARGRSETFSSARHAIYRQIEEIIAREALLVPLFHEQVYRFSRPDVQGLSLSYWLPAVTYENLSLHEPR